MPLATVTDPENDEAIAVGYLCQWLARGGLVSIAAASVAAARAAALDALTPAERLRAIADRLDARVAQ